MTERDQEGQRWENARTNSGGNFRISADCKLADLHERGIQRSAKSHPTSLTGRFGHARCIWASCKCNCHLAAVPAKLAA
jgi:hypothetical protein